MKQFDTDIFLQDLNSVPWDCAFVHDDINDIWSGADGISPRLLKFAGPRIFSSLTKLINQCIVRGTWPTDWKTSIVSFVTFLRRAQTAHRDNKRDLA